jgi:hypothetical protein
VTAGGFEGWDFCGFVFTLPPDEAYRSLMPTIVEPDGASIVLGVFYAEANLSSTFGRFVAADCAADRGPSCHCRAASCSPRPVLPSRTLVGSPRLAWRPLALLVTDGG